MYVLVYLFFNTLSIHVKLMNEMQIDKMAHISNFRLCKRRRKEKKKKEKRRGKKGKKKEKIISLNKIYL